MASNSSSDSSDPFADAVSFPQFCYLSGQYQGIQDGLRQGYFEGKELGIKKGAGIGGEMGFYAAITHIFTQIIQQNQRKNQYQQIKTVPHEQSNTQHGFSER